MPVTVSDLSVSHGIAHRLHRDSIDIASGPRMPVEEDTWSAEEVDIGRWGKLLEAGRTSPMLGCFAAGRSPTRSDGDHPLVSPTRGIGGVIPSKPFLRRRQMLDPPQHDDSDVFALSEEFQEQGMGSPDVGILQEQVGPAFSDARLSQPVFRVGKIALPGGVLCV